MSNTDDELAARKAIEKANRAREITESSVFKEAMENVAKYIEEKTLSCDPDNTKMAQRIIITRQIARSFEREFIKAIHNGEAAKFKLAEIEKARTVGQKILMR